MQIRLKIVDAQGFPGTFSFMRMLSLVIVGGYCFSTVTFAHSILSCRTADKDLLPYHRITITPAEEGVREFTVRIVTRKDELGHEIDKVLVHGVGEITAKQFYVEIEGGPVIRGKRQGNGNWKTDLTDDGSHQELRCQKK